MSDVEHRGQTIGFSSAGEEFRSRRLDLNELLVRRPASTFFLRAAEDSDLCGGIRAGDILVVDRALDPDLAGGSLVVVEHGGEMLLRLLFRRRGRLRLRSDDGRTVEAGGEIDLHLFGVVTSVLHLLDSR